MLKYYRKDMQLDVLDRLVRLSSAKFKCSFATCTLGQKKKKINILKKNTQIIKAAFLTA
jgi:hypothetical protein